MTRRLLHFLAAGFCFLFISTAMGTANDPFVIRKMEPPHWWKGMKTTKIEVMVTGEGLRGVQVSAKGGGLSVGPATASANGHYAFFEVTIPSHLAAGSHTLIFSAPPSRARQREFLIKDKLPPQGRFQGIDAQDVLYLIMPDRFADHNAIAGKARPAVPWLDRSDSRGRHGGTLEGIRQHLPYVHELGATALWLTPMYLNGQNRHPKWGVGYHGYWIADHYQLEPKLGDLDVYRRLVDQAHGKGIKIIQDQVLNHTATGHSWVKDPPTPTWFNGSPESHLENKYDIGALVDPHSSLLAKRATLEGWFGNDLPDLNQGDPHVAKYLIQNSLWWLAETGADAVRLDAYPYVPRSFWSKWQQAFHDEFPTVSIIGEITGDVPHEVAFFQGGRNCRGGVDTGLQLVFDFPLGLILRSVLARDKDMQAIPKVLEQDWLYPNPSGLVTFFGNHDLPRLATAVAEDTEKIKLAHALLLSCRGTPQLYAADEIGGIGAGDPDNRRDFPGGFADGQHSAFDPTQRTPRERDLLEHVKEWIKVRKQNEALTKGELITLFVDKECWLFLRRTPVERVLVAVSISAQPRKVSHRLVDELADVAEFSPLVRNAPPASTTDKVEFTLPAFGAAAWRIVGKCR
jgi:glycosidase